MYVYLMMMKICHRVVPKILFVIPGSKQLTQFLRRYLYTVYVTAFIYSNNRHNTRWGYISLKSRWIRNATRWCVQYGEPRDKSFVNKGTRCWRVAIPWVSDLSKIIYSYRFNLIFIHTWSIEKSYFKNDRK